MNKLSIIYTVLSDMDQANFIGQTLIEMKLVACVNIIPKVHSIYYWNGELCEDSELILLAKTVKERVFKTIKKIEEMHNYDTPCIFEIETNVNESYFNWVVQSLDIAELI